MRHLHALRHAMRTRRTHRIDLTEADRLAAGDRPGTAHPGLADLLEAARQPATADELAGEKTAVAAFSDARRRAAPRLKRRAGTVLAEIAVAVALLAVCGTAAAARTGHLPVGAQQHAHHLFSALGVPAPRTGPTQTAEPLPHRSASPEPSRSRSKPPPASPSASAPTGPSASASADPAALAGWCRSWRATPSPDPGQHRKLTEAAGGEDRIDEYCKRSPTPDASPSAGPSASRSPSASPSASPSPKASRSRTPSPTATP